LVAGLLLPAGARAQVEQPLEPPPPNPAAAAFDVVILRPMGLVALAVGVVAFVPVALITAPGGKDSLKTGLEIFVTGPAKNVFQRPLGDF
jgi:hypothetical protein